MSGRGQRRDRRPPSAVAHELYQTYCSLAPEVQGFARDFVAWMHRGRKVKPTVSVLTLGRPRDAIVIPSKRLAVFQWFLGLTQGGQEVALDVLRTLHVSRAATYQDARKAL